MIESKDLRIGNLVYNNENVIHEIHGVAAIWITSRQPNIAEPFENASIKHYNPIDLTEKLLLKFGFDKPFKTIGGFEKWQKGEFRLLDGKLIPLSKIEIKYVHQLQNLYFALTGEELTIK